MDLAAMGSGGAGLVWGWMLALSGGPRRGRPGRDANLVAAVGSMVLLAEVAALTHARAVGACASAGLVGTAAASAWRRRLRAASLAATKGEGA